MKKFMFALTVVLLLCFSRLSAHTQSLVFIVSVNGGASFGRENIKITSGGLASLVITPNEGILNLSSGVNDFRGDLSTVLSTPRNFNEPSTDTIVENFDYRIRVAVSGAGVTPATLGQPSPSFPYIEFRQTGMYTLADIKEGSVTRTFNSSPFGGDFGGTGTSSQTLFLEGAGQLTLSGRAFNLPGQPQFDAISGQFRSYGLASYRLATSVSVSGRITLQGAANSAQPLTFEFQPTDNSSAFQRTITPNADGTYSLPDILRKTYTVRVKGAKWLAKTRNIDTTQGNVSDVNFILLAGDANNDNFIDIDDLLLLTNAYNQIAPNADYVEAVDFNDDGANDINDLLLLIGNYNVEGD